MSPGRSAPPLGAIAGGDVGAGGWPFFVTDRLNELPEKL
jgi:hypothetical protein